MFEFETPLIRATLLKRNSQFTATVLLVDETITVYFPNTSSIGDIKLENIPCLLSYHDDKSRKYQYSIEALLLIN